MHPTCFSKVNNCDATSKLDTDGGTWLQAMCLHISNKRWKPLIKSLGTKQFCKSSYTIFEKPSDERHGKQATIKINAFVSKTRSIFGWKSLTKGGKLTSANGWRWRRAKMVVADKATKMLEANACIVWTYIPTWISARAQHNHVDGGGVKFNVIFLNHGEANGCAQIMCSFCNVS